MTLNLIQRQEELQFSLYFI